MFLIELMYTLQSYRSLFMNRFDETKLNKRDKEESARLLVEFAKDLFKQYSIPQTSFVFFCLFFFWFCLDFVII